MGILAVLFFVIFRENLFSLKMTVLLFSAARFIARYLFLINFFHSRVALFALVNSDSVLRYVF